MNKIVLAVLLFTGVIIIAGGLMVVAVNAAAPGNLLYGVNHQVEALRLKFASGMDAPRYLIPAEYPGPEDTATTEVTDLPDGTEIPVVTDEPEETETPEETESPDASTTPEPGRGGSHCDGTGTAQQPEGARLASRYSVSYDEIMGHFCGDGLGFGEIDHAYSISQFAGVPVAEMIDLRNSGMGWGQIKQKYGLIGSTKPPKSNGTGQGNTNGQGNNSSQDKTNNGHSNGHGKGKGHSN